MDAVVVGDGASAPMGYPELCRMLNSSDAGQVDMAQAYLARTGAPNPTTPGTDSVQWKARWGTAEEREAAAAAVATSETAEARRAQELADWEAEKARRGGKGLARHQWIMGGCVLISWILAIAIFASADGDGGWVAMGIVMLVLPFALWLVVFKLLPPGIRSACVSDYRDQGF